MRSSQRVLTRSGVAVGCKWMQTRLVQTSLRECVARRGMSGDRETDRFAEIDENVGPCGINGETEKWKGDPLSATSLDSILNLDLFISPFTVDARAASRKTQRNTSRYCVCGDGGCVARCV